MAQSRLSIARTICKIPSRLNTPMLFTSGVASCPYSMLDTVCNEPRLLAAEELTTGTPHTGHVKSRGMTQRALFFAHETGLDRTILDQVAADRAVQRMVPTLIWWSLTRREMMCSVPNCTDKTDLLYEQGRMTCHLRLAVVAPKKQTKPSEYLAARSTKTNFCTLDFASSPGISSIT